MNHLMRRDLVSSTRCCGECPCSGEVATIVGNGEEKDLLLRGHMLRDFLTCYVSLHIFRGRSRLQQQ